MLTKNDLLLLLTDLEEKGIDTKAQETLLFKSNGIPKDVLKFINDNRQLDVAGFYEMLRSNYNKKKSPLYKNLVKEEFKDASDVLTTLAALNLQILLYAKHLEDSKMFLKHSRAEEVTEVLNNYYKTYDLIPCFKCLKLVKSDLKVFEMIR